MATAASRELSPNDSSPPRLTMRASGSTSKRAPSLSNLAAAMTKIHLESTLSASRFTIYPWEHPRPKDFLNLTDSRKAWKRRTDAEQKADDVDDGSDDWSQFPGEELSESPTTQQRIIANVFMHRAKRAFWAGKTWAEFEIEERSATDVADDLDNEVRLSVFDELKDRLCEEIWLEEHEEPAEVAELGLAVAGRDSKVPTPTPPPGSAAASAGSASIQPGIRAADRILPPRDVERADGVTGWQADRGMLQPLYGDEKRLPNGVQNAMAQLRSQEVRERAAKREWNAPRTPHWARQPARIGDIGLNGTLPITMAEALALRKPEFESSDEEAEKK